MAASASMTCRQTNLLSRDFTCRRLFLQHIFLCSLCKSTFKNIYRQSVNTFFISRSSSLTTALIKDTLLSISDTAENCVAICTCSSAHAPGGQAVRRSEAVEHTNILRRQELHKLGVLEHVSFAVEDGGSLIRNVDYPSCVERHCYCKNVLLKRQNENCGINEKINCSDTTN